MAFLRSLVLLAAALALAACDRTDLNKPPVPLGDFTLGLNIAVADNVQKVPISRDATPDEWEAAMKKAVQERFGRYSGSTVYNIGISVDAYALAPPGIPIIAAPKSVLVITANIWDDAKQKKLNEEGFRITVMERLSGDTVIGTGLTRTRKQQMDALSYNAVFRVQEWLLQHPEWFPATPGPANPTAPLEGAAAPASAPLATPTAAQATPQVERPLANLPQSAYVP